MPGAHDSPVRGLSRRDFLAYCGTLATVIGLGEAGVPQVAAALEEAVKRPVLVWSDFQECLGCTIALLQSTSPTPAQLILQQVSLAYNEAAMAAAGFQAEQSFKDAFDEGAYWVIEGSVATTPAEAISISGKTSQEILKEFYPKAKGVIAIGSCACFGNVQAREPNPSGAMGVGKWLREQGGFPDAAVINCARCPGHGEDLVAVLTYILVMGKLPDLDSQGRPLFLYGQTIHDNCERRGHFEAGEFVEEFGDEGSQKRWCFYKVGCKGPVTYAPCGVNRWNGRVSWCIHSGPCTGCSEDNFWNDFSPLATAVPNIPVPAIQGVSAQQIGIGLTAVTAVGLGAHFVGQAVTGRLGKGGPMDAPDGDKGSTGKDEGAKGGVE
jgi:hydrogenase small subunit